MNGSRVSLEAIVRWPSHFGVAVPELPDADHTKLFDWKPEGLHNAMPTSRFGPLPAAEPILPVLFRNRWRDARAAEIYVLDWEKPRGSANTG